MSLSSTPHYISQQPEPNNPTAHPPHICHPAPATHLHIVHCTHPALTTTANARSPACPVPRIHHAAAADNAHVPLPLPIPLTLNWILNPPSPLPIWLHLELDHPPLRPVEPAPGRTLLAAAKSTTTRRAPFAPLLPNRPFPYHIPHRDATSDKPSESSFPRNRNVVHPLLPPLPRFNTPPTSAYVHKLVSGLQTKLANMPKASTKESKTTKPVKRAKKDKDAPKR